MRAQSQRACVSVYVYVETVRCCGGDFAEWWRWAKAMDGTPQQETAAAAAEAKEGRCGVDGAAEGALWTKRAKHS